MSVSYVLERKPAVAGTGDIPADTPERRRVYILPTREGVIFFLFLLTMLLGAVNYNNSLAYLLTFLLGSLYLVCILHTHRNLSGLVINGEAARPVFAGDIARFPVLIDNRNAPERPSVILELNPLHDQAGKPLRKRADPASLHIPENRFYRSELPVQTRYRGVISPGRVSVSTRYPLGLFRAWSNIEIDQTCIVYPRPGGTMPLPKPALSDQQGQTGLATGTDDFTGFRNYQHGDSIRNIAWKILSRGQPLLVKKFSGNTGETLTLSWNQVLHLNDTEDRLSQLCAWILTAEQRGLMYGLELPGKEIPPGQGEQHRQNCLAALAGFGLHDVA